MAPNVARPEPAPALLCAARDALAAAWLVAALAYLGWRCGVVNPAAPAFSAFFLIAEALGIAWAGVFVFANLRFRERIAPPPPRDLAVDVFVPSYNEPVALVRRTLIAARRIRYPHQTWLLDDGAREPM